MKGRLFLILFALPFAGVGAWMLYSAGSHLLDALAMQSWQPVEARLLEAGYETRSGDDSDTWEAYATYRYTWNGETYTGDRVAISRGADNLGSYQRDLGNRLSGHVARGETVTAWIDPERPGSSVIDRQPRWGLVAFKGVFVLVFGGFGFGMIAVAVLRSAPKDPDNPAFAGKPWLANDAWQGGPIRSGSKTTMWAAWGFAIFWNLISMPLPFLLVDEITVKKNYPALLGLLFPLVGLGLLTWAIRKTLEWRRWGVTPLALDPFPGAIGGHVGGHIDLRMPYAGATDFKLTLTSLKSYVSGSGKNRSRREKAAWQDRQLAYAEPGPLGTRVSFRFDVPAGLGESDAAKSGDTYTIWRLALMAETDGSDVDRHWDIPVYATGARSSDIDERRIREAAAVQSAADDAVVKTRVQLLHTPHGKSLYYPVGRNLAGAALGILFGAVFAGAGGFLVMKEEAVFMGGIFALVGGLIVLGALYMAGNSLEVWQDGIKLHSKRRLFGIPVRHRSLHRSAFQRFETKKTMSSQSGGKHTIYYSIRGLGRSDERLTLGEGFRGRSEANAGVRLIARELGLPLPAISSDDDAAAGYNALAADPAPLENAARANDN